MGESSFVWSLSTSLLVLIGVNDPSTKKDLIRKDIDRHSGEVMVSSEKWTKVNFAELELEHLRASCRRTILKGEGAEDEASLLARLYKEQEKCKPGYDAVLELSKGQRESLIQFYTACKKKSDDEQLELSSYESDVADYLDYRRIGVSIERLHCNINA